MADAPSFDRICLIVLDSVGVGGAPDAADFGDEGADTVGHILAEVGLSLPNLARLGLGQVRPGLAALGPAEAGAYGTLAERSQGKDTMTGHFELAGVVVDLAYPTYTDTGFPAEVIDAFCTAGGLGGVLGNEAASGTEIIERLGARHVETGWPIVYTSADSVFQLAAHEDVIPIDEQYRLCRLAREQILVGDHAVARVIARPFVDGAPDGPSRFERTKRRKDFALAAPEATVLDALADAGRDVLAVGKINDIFSGRGIARHTQGKTNDECVDDTLAALRDDREAALIFVNLVDFDTQYGHRNDPAGYRDCLQAFDARLPQILDALAPRDLLLITADHGNDPCYPGTDHTRELVPLLAYHAGLRSPVSIGQRDSFADVAATIADNFAVARSTAPAPAGDSFLARLVG